MDGFSDKLKSMLSDPDSMSKIMEVAKTLSSSQNAASADGTEEGGLREEDSPVEEGAPGEEGGAPLLSRIPGLGELTKLVGKGGKERTALLHAIRPYLRAQKRDKLDWALQAMKTLDLLSLAEKVL